MKTDFATSLSHLQYRLLNKGEILIRTDSSSESQWFVNCYIYKDYEKYLNNKTSQSENKIRIYRNWVTDVDEAINNCIMMINYYEENPNAFGK